MTNLVGVRAAAAVLGLNASTVSRYLRQNPELNHAGAGASPLVDVEELRAHRAGTVNLAMSGNHAGRLLDDGNDGNDGNDGHGGAGEAPAESSAGRERRSQGGGMYARAKAAREATLAREAQLRLDEKLGRTVSRRRVEGAAAEAGQTLREGLEARNRDLAERLAALDDPREIRALLDEEDRRLLARAADVLGRNLEERS